jgi:hypothetical protein
MNDLKELLDREARLVDEAPDALESVLRRRDRKRRNQRIAAGVVGIGIFVAAVWIVTSVASLDRSETSVVPGEHVTGPVETGPVETGPTVAPDTGSNDISFRIPPERTAVSTPVEGELIAEAYRGIAGQVRVYADGRVLSAEHGGGIFVERRLSPQGVELVRQVVGERVRLGYSGALGSIWSRQGTWEDPEPHPYVPARYGACFWRVDLPPDFEALLDLLPASAQALLRGSDPAGSRRCLEVTPEEARSLEEILSEARSSRGDERYQVGAWELRDGNGDQVGISLNPLFPEGVRFVRPGY